MEHEKLSFVHKDGSVFAGAIFMSNRSTKRECMARNLFGLPHSKIKFLKQVKAGMILFLFEHEERKLYGVFEATSDGALNIIPNAFKSTGQSYPAQILFKRIWMCRPLCENEFRSAIEDNYYSPNKFNFGLSYEQVKNLIHLFYSRRILIRDQNTSTDKVSLTEVAGKYTECESDDYGRDGKFDSRRQCALPQSSMNILMHHNVADTGSGSNQVNLRTVEAQLSQPRHSYSKPFYSDRSSIYLPDDHGTFHFSIRKQHSTTTEMDYNKPLPRQPTSLDDMTVQYDPDFPKFNPTYNDMIPRIPEIRKADEFKLSHVVDDRPQTTTLQRPSVNGGQSQQFFEFPDYIPLPEEPPQNFVDLENQNSREGDYEYRTSISLSSCIPSTCKKTPIPFLGAFANIDDFGLNPYRGVEFDNRPVVVVDRRLHSDTDLSRPSVFSRLSRDQNICNQESPESSAGLSLEQFFGILAGRRERWSVRKTSEELMEWGRNEPVSKELFDQSYGHQNNNYKSKNVECVNPIEYEQSEDVTEESFELPFYNFRRRNTTQKCEVREDLNTSNGDISVGEVKSKRRKILRPSLNQEKDIIPAEAKMNISVEVKEETEVKSPIRTISENENDNQVNCGNIAVDNKVPAVQTRQISDLEGESVEVNHGTTIEASEDYIPI